MFELEETQVLLADGEVETRDENKVLQCWLSKMSGS